MLLIFPDLGFMPLLKILFFAFAGKNIGLVSKICGSIPVPVKRQAYDREQLQQL